MRADVKKIWKSYVKNLTKAMKDKYFRIGVTRATDSYEEKIRNLLTRFKESHELAQEVRAIKERVIDNIDDFVDKAINTFREHGFNVHYAETEDEAKEIVGNIVGLGKIVVKAKSITSEEIRLREYLLEKGNEVWETDLGEFILQLLNDRPMHLVTPSLHVPREKVAEIFGKLLSKKFDPSNVQELVKAASDFLRDKYYSADFGIVGANVVAALEGAIILIHNEGNIRFITSVSRELIILTGIEKIVPTLEDAMKIAYVLSRFAGYKVGGYYDIIGGPRSYNIISTAEPLQPRKIHIIFLDNGRKKMMKDPEFREAALCLRCGAYMYSCPVFKIIAGKFGGPTYMAGIGAIWTYFIDGKEKASPVIYTCLLDGRCRERCPLQIDIPKMILKLRNRLASK